MLAGKAPKEFMITCNMGQAKCYDSNHPDYARHMREGKYPPFYWEGTYNGNVELYFSVNEGKIRYNGWNHEPYFFGDGAFDGLLIGSMGRQLLKIEGPPYFVTCLGHSAPVRGAASKVLRGYRKRLARLEELRQGDEAQREAERINLVKRLLAGIDFYGGGSGEFIKFALLNLSLPGGTVSHMDSLISFSFREWGEPGFYAACTSLRRRCTKGIWQEVWQDPRKQSPSFILAGGEVGISFKTFDSV